MGAGCFSHFEATYLSFSGWPNLSTESTEPIHFFIYKIFAQKIMIGQFIAREKVRKTKLNGDGIIRNVVRSVMSHFIQFQLNFLGGTHV